jgi:hypothetical protein
MCAVAALLARAKGPLRVHAAIRSAPPKAPGLLAPATTRRSKTDAQRPALVPKGLVSVAEASKKVGLARQTIHEYMADGTVRWIYEEGRDRMWLDGEELVRLRRRQMHRPQERRHDE